MLYSSKYLYKLFRESTLHDLQCVGEEERSSMVSAMVSIEMFEYCNFIIIYSKDPDAPVREKKPLSDLDMVKIHVCIVYFWNLRS